MYSIYRLTAVLIGASLLLASESLAEGVHFPFKLPNCPTMMSISAPEIFAGGEQQQQIIDELSAQQGLAAATFVLAIAAPSKTSVLLLVQDPAGTRSVQGRVTPEQFDEMKKQVLATSAVQTRTEASDLLPDGIVLSDMGSFRRSSTPNSATVISAMAVEIPGSSLKTLMGFKVSYLHNCVVGAMLVAPSNSMSIEAFEALMQSVLVY